MDSIFKVTRLPQVDQLLRHPLLLEQQKFIRRPCLVDIVRQVLDAYRLQAAGNDAALPDTPEIVKKITDRVAELLKPSLRKVINGTGIILNTNLGRAPLATECIKQIQTASGYCNLEIDLSSGKRGERAGRIEELLQLFTGGESALVVNNNAAAVSLAVNTFSKNRETIVSRGELIEIGGSFRLPDVIKAAGGKLIEVGTTNRTRASDYSQAIGERTGLLMRCHRSNFEIHGYTQEAELSDLVKISAGAQVPMLEDLGSGMLIECDHIQLNEPTVASVVSAGCDLVTFSADKLLGGPQSGIIVGKRKYIDRLRKNPFYRVFRADKLVLAALEATLALYLCPDPIANIPSLLMTAQSIDDLRQRAQRFAQLAGQALKSITCSAVPTEAAAGGGSLPGHRLPSFGIVVQGNLSANRLAKALRQSEPPIISVIHEQAVVIDFRTISKEEENSVLQSLKQIDIMQGSENQP